MNESLFSRLFHYSKTDNRTPQEDYLTELLAWMIDNLAQFGQDYVTFLCSNSNPKIQQKEKCSVNAETQVVVSKGRIDMVITVDSSMCFVCEHKVDSSLAIDQITKYKHCREEIKERYHVENVYYVFLSKIADKLEKEQKPDITIRWHEIYNYFNGKKFDNNSFEPLMVKQFLEYLTEVGMGENNIIRLDDVKYYCGAMRLLPTLKSIFDELRISVDWEEECKGIQRFVSDYSPTSVNNKIWGRIGISFSNSWEPSIFAGVVYNNDHKLQYFQDQPLLAILIDCKDPEFTKQFKDKNRTWLNNVDNVETNHKFIIESAPESPWRALVLEKQLADVLADSNSYEQQKDAIKNEIIKGINLILKYYNENT